MTLLNASSTTRNEELYPTPVSGVAVAASTSELNYGIVGEVFSRFIGIV
jgi:hypothetical protein